MTHEEVMALLQGEVVKALQADRERAEEYAVAERELGKAVLAAGEDVVAWTETAQKAVSACVRRLQELRGCDCWAKAECDWCIRQLRRILDEKPGVHRELAAGRLLAEWTRQSRLPPKAEGEDG